MSAYSGEYREVSVDTSWTRVLVQDPTRCWVRISPTAAMTWIEWEGDPGSLLGNPVGANDTVFSVTLADEIWMKSDTGTITVRVSVASGRDQPFDGDV